MSNIWYNRFYETEIENLLEKGKVFVLYGPRRAGKTSMINNWLKTSNKGKYFYGSGDDRLLRDILSSENISRITSSFKGYDLIFIDEAQNIPLIGSGLKIIADHLPETKVIATGSSSFKLSGKLGSPLTGRQNTALLFPLSMLELASQFGRMQILNNLDEYLIYGTYPETLTAENYADKKRYLLQLADSYLFKDIIELENLRNSALLSDLLQLLVFQIGHEVSLNELGKNLGVAKQTVERYLFLLEKSFIIKQVRGFSRNLRKEISKTRRYYFYDNGIRNALINNFNDLNLRNDTGMLWENFLFMERLKKQTYTRAFPNMYFWRTYDKQEIDLVEEQNGKLKGYEFKWGNKKSKTPALWKETYPDSSFEIISLDNFLEFVV